VDAVDPEPDPEGNWYDYVVIEGPTDVPLPEWLGPGYQPCEDCDANLLLRWQDQTWDATVAHDATCPTYAQIILGDQPAHTARLRMWAIYDGPTDFPDKFVVRGHTATGRGTVPDALPLCVADSLAEARRQLREAIGPGAQLVPNDPDATIVECWV
jgi:hypothetical protein